MGNTDDYDRMRLQWNQMKTNIERVTIPEFAKNRGPFEFWREGIGSEQQTMQPHILKYL